MVLILRLEQELSLIQSTGIIQSSLLTTTTQTKQMPKDKGLDSKLKLLFPLTNVEQSTLTSLIKTKSHHMG
jgi:hypothetical protein